MQYVTLVCGFVYCTQEKPGKHLPYDSPKLVQVRQYVAWAVQEGGVHERLVMNFDQVRCSIALVTICFPTVMILPTLL